MQIDSFVSEERTNDGIVIPTLCHGDTIMRIELGNEDISACDGLVTENKSLSLGVTTADCAPICFGDETKIGIAHIGWRGLCLGLIEKMCTEFDTEKLEVFVGPHLHSFEVQKDFCYEAIVGKFGEDFFTLENGKITFRFKDALVSLLPINTIFDGRNTEEDTSLPSHRRNKTNERIVTVVEFKK